jgi:SAM-dependent methyltransferase
MKYTHLEEKHNLTAPRIIVPIVNSMIKPTSVVDVGCGLGTFLKAFKELGVKNVLGLDGKWVNRNLLFKYIEPDEFKEVDLESPIQVNRRFDLVISVEVAEHLSEKRADGFVNDLVKLGDNVLFSAAIPGQGGDHHINEQWISYWREKFERHGYQLRDLFRDKLWDNQDVFWWYRQNMFLFVSEKSFLYQPSQKQPEKVLHVVHPDLFHTWINYRDKNAIKRYTKVLAKAIAYKLGFLK